VYAPGPCIEPSHVAGKVCTNSRYTQLYTGGHVHAWWRLYLTIIIIIIIIIIVIIIIIINIIIFIFIFIFIFTIVNVKFNGGGTFIFPNAIIDLPN